MTLETALDALKPYHSELPTAALEFIRNNWNEAEPHLLAELDRGITDPLRTDQSALFLYALFLCAELNCEAAYERYLRILRLPNLLLDHLIGDILTENMKEMLARTCGGLTEPLKALVEDETVNEFARSAALQALVKLVAVGSLARDETVEYCLDLLTHQLERRPSFVWDAVVTMAEQLYITEALPLIEAAYQQGLADPETQTFNEVKAVLSRPQEQGHLAAERERIASFDTIDKMSFFVRNWKSEASSSQPESTDLLAEPRAARLQQFPVRGVKVGRNEPCPCGSGKKYKKCCIDLKNAPIPVAAMPDSAQLNLADEWIDAGYYYLKKDRPHKAMTCWWNGWQEVKIILPETIHDPGSDECNRLFTRCDFFSNWLQDYQLLIEENMKFDPVNTQNGLCFCLEVAQRFPAMSPLAMNNLLELTAHLQLTLGDPAPAFSLLEQMIENQPQTAQGYVVLADLLSIDAQRFNLHPDIDRARQLLLQALEKATDCDAWDVDVRLEGLDATVSL